MYKSEEDVQLCEVGLVISALRRDYIGQGVGRKTRKFICSTDRLLNGMNMRINISVFVNGKGPESENFLSVTIGLKKIPPIQLHADVMHWGVVSITDNNGDSRFSQSFGWDSSRIRNTTFPPIVIEKLVKFCTLLNNPDEYFPDDTLKIHCSIFCTEKLTSTDHPVDSVLPVFPNYPFDHYGGCAFIVGKAEGPEYRLDFDTRLFAYLKAESPVFRAMAEHDVKERRDQFIVILPDESFAFLLLERFLATGDLGDMDELTNFEYLCELYTMTDKYQLSRVHEMCSDILGSGINDDSVTDIFILADRHNDERLKSEIARYLYEHKVELKLSSTRLKLPDGLEDHPELTDMLIQENNSDSSYGAIPLERTLGKYPNKTLAEVPSYIN